jgi:ribonuclease Z
MITAQVLGYPGRDNAVFVTIDTGHRQVRVLLDCGQGCPARLGQRDLRNIDHLVISHFHMDHVCGFDVLLRAVYSRCCPPLQVWGPPGTLKVMAHRLQAFTWNLIEDCPGMVLVHEVDTAQIRTACFRAREGFRRAHPRKPASHQGVLLAADDFRMLGTLVDHGIPCLAVALEEQPAVNLDMQAGLALGLRPGLWCKLVKDFAVPDTEFLEIASQRWQLADLRRRLLRTTVGRRIGYVVDTAGEAATIRNLAPVMAGADPLFCECSYRDEDDDLARQNHHLTATMTGQLAAGVGARGLVPIHVSDRYPRQDLPAMLLQIRQQFSHANWPREWDLPHESPPGSQESEGCSGRLFLRREESIMP